LLELYSDLQASLEASPERLAKRKVFEEALYQASQDDSFNDQLPSDGIRAWVQSAWRDRQR
jgi:hypothetical protein